MVKQVQQVVNGLTLFAPFYIHGLNYHFPGRDLRTFGTGNSNTQEEFKHSYTVQAHHALEMIIS